jgi:hypothetical protein
MNLFQQSLFNEWGYNNNQDINSDKGLGGQDAEGSTPSVGGEIGQHESFAVSKASAKEQPLWAARK